MIALASNPLRISFSFITLLPLETVLKVFKVNIPSKEGTTVFLRARTRPSGEPKRKKSDTSKSNFPRAPPPSSIVLLLDRREPGSFLKTLECRLYIYTIYIIIHIFTTVTSRDALTYQENSANIYN